MRGLRTMGCFVCIFTSGCGSSFWSARESNPVIYDYVAPNVFTDTTLNVLATTASRRIVLIKQGPGESIVSCAEAPPDVAEAFSAAVAAGLDQSIALEQGSDTKVGARSAGNFLREAATAVAPLLYRTQGLQFYRDVQYSLCIDLLSGRLKEEEYNKKKENLFHKSLALIKIEVPQMLSAQQEFYKNIKPFGLTVQDAVQILNAVKPSSGVAQTPGTKTPDGAKPADTAKPSQ